MIYILVGTANGLLLFLCVLKAYALGLRHGKELIKGNAPTIKLNPIQAIREHAEAKENKKQNDLIAEGLQNLMNYNGEPQEV